MSGIEVFVISRAQLDLATALDGERVVAVEFQFVVPLGKPLRAGEQHRLDEFRFGLRTWHRGLHDGSG